MNKQNVIEKTAVALIAVVFIFIGYKIITVQKAHWKGQLMDFSDPVLHWPIGLAMICFGLYILFLNFMNKK